jgi:hypothetical protein
MTHRPRQKGTTMRTGEQDRLDTATWLQQLSRLVDDLATEDACPGRHIRRAYHLQRLAPQSMGPMLAAQIDEESLEAVLETGSYDEAVTLLVGDDVMTASQDTRLAVAGDGPSLSPSSNSDCDPNGRVRERLKAWAARYHRVSVMPQWQ